MSRKVLFFKVGGLGDTLMTTPLIRKYKKNFPNDRLIGLVGDNSSIIYKRNPYLEEVIEVDAGVFLKKKIIQIIMLVIKYLFTERFNKVFVLGHHNYFSIFTLLSFPISERIGFTRFGKEGFGLHKKVDFRGKKHDIHYYLDLLKEVGGDVEQKDFQMDFQINESRISDDLRSLDFDVGICPFAGSKLTKLEEFNKEWPVYKWEALLNKLNDKKVAIFGKLWKEKLRKISEIFLEDQQNITSFINKLNLDETAFLMKKCGVLITGDSGLMHLALSQGCKVIALFGPTAPYQKGPLDDKSISIWKQEEPIVDVYGQGWENSSKSMDKVEVSKVLSYILKL